MQKITQFYLFNKQDATNRQKNPLHHRSDNRNLYRLISLLL